MLRVGDTLEGVPVGPLSPEALADMAVVLADPNPIHLDAAVVAALGLGDRQIVQGPIGLGVILSMLAHAAPGMAVHVLDVRFAGNVYAGDVVQAIGTVEAAADATVHVDVALRAGERVVVTGRAELVAS